MHPLQEAIASFSPGNNDIEDDGGQNPAFIIVTYAFKNVAFDIGPFLVTNGVTAEKQTLQLLPEHKPVFDKIICARFEGHKLYDEGRFKFAEWMWESSELEMESEGHPTLHMELIYGSQNQAWAALQNMKQDETLYMFTLCERIVEPHIEVQSRDDEAELVEKVKEQLKESEFHFKFGPERKPEEKDESREIGLFLTYKEVKQVVDKAAFLFAKDKYRLRGLKDKVDPTMEVEVILQGNKITGLLIVKQVKVTKDSREDGKCRDEWDKEIGQL